MPTVELVLGEATLAVASQTFGGCGLLRLFLEAIKGSDIQITSENISG
jgi:hypothetical protein